MKKIFQNVLAALTITAICTVNMCFLAAAEEYSSADGCVYEYSASSRGTSIVGITFNSEVTSLEIPSEIGGKKITSFGNHMKIDGNIEQIKSISFEEGSNITFLSLREFENLETVTFPSSQKKIPDDCFNSCKKLKHATISEGVESIGFSCFKNCEYLEKITIPSSVTEIGDEAFYNCKSLADIEWDKNINIGRKVFDGTAYVNNYPEDFLLTHNNTVLYKYTGKDKTAVIPDSVKRIEEYAFSASAAEKIVYPSTLKTITMHAFSEAYNLKDMEFKGKIDEIETEAFSYCTSLEKPIIPDGITEIPPCCFMWCENMQTAKIPSHIKKIGESAFACNKSLKTLEFEDGLEIIDFDAFLDCSELTKVTIPKTVKTIKSGAFNRCDKIDLTMNKATVRETDRPETTLMPKIVSTTKPTKKPLETIEPTAKPKETAVPAASPEPKKLEVKGGEEITISVDGKAVEFDAKPFIDGNNRTLVPVRAVSEMLDAKVDWDGANQTVTIAQDGKIITIVIGSDTMTVDGNNVKMDTQAVISEDRTYIPIRFAAEALGLTVDWEK